MKPYPLTRSNRIQLARLFTNVPRVDISIDCVLEDQMGKAFVDSVDNPRYAMIEIDEFFCYLAGDFTQPAGQNFIEQMPSGRMVMAGSESWHEAIQSFKDKNHFKPITRYRYSSRTLSHNYLQTLAIRYSYTPHIQRIDKTIAKMGLPYFEIGAFDSPEDFVQRGIGYCLLDENKALIGIIYSSLVNSHAVEVSIVVQPEHQRRGIATALSCQFLMWCLDRQIEPHWDAANPESCYLAEKLGYKALGEYTAYVSQ